MPLNAVISWGESEIILPEDVISRYQFNYEIDDVYAKTYPKSVGLVLELDVSEILSNDTVPLEENEKLLEKLNEWGACVFAKSSTEQGYYRRVALAHIYADEVFREIEMGSVYMENYTEAIDGVTGKRVLRLGLRQREDMLVYEGNTQREGEV
jgi:hypothetical protein